MASIHSLPAHHSSWHVPAQSLASWTAHSDCCTMPLSSSVTGRAISCVPDFVCSILSPYFINVDIVSASSVFTLWIRCTFVHTVHSFKTHRRLSSEHIFWHFTHLVDCNLLAPLSISIPVKSHFTPAFAVQFSWACYYFWICHLQSDSVCFGICQQYSFLTSLSTGISFNTIWRCIVQFNASRVFRRMICLLSICVSSNLWCAYSVFHYSVWRNSLPPMPWFVSQLFLVRCRSFHWLSLSAFAFSIFPSSTSFHISIPTQVVVVFDRISPFHRMLPFLLLSLPLFVSAAGDERKWTTDDGIKIEIIKKIPGERWKSGWWKE